MPRSNQPRRRGAAARPKSQPLDLERARGGYPVRQSEPDGDWFVRTISAPAATKEYRCPGCQQVIPPGVAHVVAWPAGYDGDRDSGIDERRHWHSSCLAARRTRGPRHRR